LLAYLLTLIISEQTSNMSVCLFFSMAGYICCFYVAYTWS